MNIFLSWSGDRSKEVARALKEWLPDVFQGDHVFISEHDIEAGSRWNDKLNHELGLSHFGIICLTPENINAPWLLFEAGALSKAIQESHVVPYLLELKSTDFTGPLTQFQSVISNKEGTWKLLQSINKIRENKLPDSQLERIFTKWWPDLKAKINDIPPLGENTPPDRPDRDLLEEVLSTVRSFNYKVRYNSESQHGYELFNLNGLSYTIVRDNIITVFSNRSPDDEPIDIGILINELYLKHSIDIETMRLIAKDVLNKLGIDSSNWK